MAAHYLTTLTEDHQEHLSGVWLLHGFCSTNKFYHLIRKRRGFKDNINNMSHLLQDAATAHGRRLQHEHTLHQLNNTDPPSGTTEAGLREMEDRSKVKGQFTPLTRSLRTRLQVTEQRDGSAYLHLLLPFPFC